MDIYRAVQANKASPGKLIAPQSTARPPGNVPYLVDNLWEWARPEGMPCRRQAVYASPHPASALKSGADGSRAYRVVFAGAFKAAQLIGYEDSKYHPDCRHVARWVLRALGQAWVDAPVEDKVALGRLWMPCVTKGEVNHILTDHAAQAGLSVDELVSRITYWNDVRLVEDAEAVDPNGGEVFFEPTDGYRLQPLDGDSP